MAKLLEPSGGGRWLEVRAGQSLSVMGYLWNRMVLRFGAEWERQFSAATLAMPELRVAWEREWADAFADADLSFQQVRMALTGCSRMQQPPTLAQFLALAAPVADVQLAFDEARANLAAMRCDLRFVWSHPAVYWAAQEVGAELVLSQSWASIKGRWRDELKRQLRRVSWPAAPVYEPRSAQVAAVSRRSRASEVLGVIKGGRG